MVCCFGAGCGWLDCGSLVGCSLRLCSSGAELIWFWLLQLLWLAVWIVSVFGLGRCLLVCSLLFYCEFSYWLHSLVCGFWVVSWFVARDWFVGGWWCYWFLGFWLGVMVAWLLWWFGCMVCDSLDLRLVCLFTLLLCSYWLIVLCILCRGNHFAFCWCVCVVSWLCGC